MRRALLAIVVLGLTQAAPPLYGRSIGAQPRIEDVEFASHEDIFSKYTADSDSVTVPRYDEALQARTEPYIWPDFLGIDTDSGETLKTLSIPGLWLFSDNDGSIPVDMSIERLKALREEGHRYDYVLFSGLGHNNMSRTFATAVDWVKRQ